MIITLLIAAVKKFVSFVLLIGEAAVSSPDIYTPKG